MNKVIIAVVFITGLLVYLFSPVCIPLSQKDLQSMNVPIEQRTDRDFYMRIFQMKDEEWYQCKTRISRIFFM